MVIEMVFDSAVAMDEMMDWQTEIRMVSKLEVWKAELKEDQC